MINQSIIGEGGGIFWFVFYRHYRGGPLINVFLRVYFALCFFLWFWVFIAIIGGTPDKCGIPDKRILFFFGVFIGIIAGTPDKRISEGLF